MNVVVVESPAKAKTINKYLGPGYKVLASFGHVRDLPAKDGSVQPDNDFAMTWEVDSASAKRVNEIAEAVKNADALFLATDPDREGEAISFMRFCDAASISQDMAKSLSGWTEPSLAGKSRTWPNEARTL